MRITANCELGNLDIVCKLKSCYQCLIFGLIVRNKKIELDGKFHYNVILFS